MLWNWNWYKDCLGFKRLSGKLKLLRVIKLARLQARFLQRFWRDSNLQQFVKVRSLKLYRKVRGGEGGRIVSAQALSWWSGRFRQSRFWNSHYHGGPHVCFTLSRPRLPTAWVTVYTMSPGNSVIQLHLESLLSVAWLELIQKFVGWLDTWNVVTN